MKDLHRYIDHTLLKATASEDEILQLSAEAIKHHFYAVCVNSSNVPLVAKKLQGSGIEICSVIGFPLGAMSTASKVFEAKQAIEDGATEIDMVINLGELKSKNFLKVEEEIAAVKQVVKDRILKVIIETCYLTREELVLCSRMAVKAGADFVKTSTGFGSSGAQLEDISTIRKTLNGKAKIKASGGIKNRDTALAFIEAGAERIGTSSGVSIVNEMKK